MQVEDGLQSSLRDFRRIPGIGPNLAMDLWDLGYRSVEELRNADPQAMYEAHCAQTGMPVDRCVLYAFRCAVYFATTENPDPEKLKWWNWKG
jgi:hypothetical protein